MVKEFYKWVENTVEKGEIARYEQFLLFPQCFLRLVLQSRKNQDLFGKGIKRLSVQRSISYVLRNSKQVISQIVHLNLQYTKLVTLIGAKSTCG